MFKFNLINKQNITAFLIAFTLLGAYLYGQYGHKFGDTTPASVAREPLMTFYKWKDENGSWQYSNIQPTHVSSIKFEIGPNENLLEALREELSEDASRNAELSSNEENQQSFAMPPKFLRFESQEKGKSTKALDKEHKTLDNTLKPLPI